MTHDQTIERIQAARQNLTQMAGALPAGPKAALEDALRGLSVAIEELKLDKEDAANPAGKVGSGGARQGDERYRQLWTSGTDYVYTVSIQNGRSVGTIHSPGCVAVTGYTADEYASDPYLWYRMVHRDDRKAVLEQAASARSGKETYPLEHRILHKSGELRWVRNAPMPRYDAQGRLVGYDGVITDITERKKTDATLRESEEKYRALFQASLDAIFLETLDGRIIDCNVAACKMLGYTKEEMLKLSVSDLVPQEVARILPTLIKKEFENGGMMLESLNKRKDGQIIPCEVSTCTITLGGEKRAIVYVRDITERKLAEQARLRQIEAETHAAVSDAAKLELEREVAERKLAESALRESEARLHALIDNLPFEFWAADGDLRYTMQNTTSIKNYGNVVGKHIAELDIPKAVTDEWVKQDQLALNGEILHLEYERNVNGETRVYENLVAPVIVEQAIVGIVGVGMDVAERKRAEHALEQRARQLTWAGALPPCWIWIACWSAPRT
jgi:PAS domain S-box-containing protein